MKIRNLTLTIASFSLISGIATAQDIPSEGLETTQSKTYTVNMGDEVVKRTVEISTKRANTIQLKDTDSTKIDQSRMMDSTLMITKTVKIDNDRDDAFDEKIVFTYKSDTAEDFVLISNNKELTVAIDNGQDLKIVENMSLKSKYKSEVDNIETYIFTDNQGKEIEFLVEEYNSGTNTINDSK